jgi:hypothetical protein
MLNHNEVVITEYFSVALACVIDQAHTLCSTLYTQSMLWCCTSAPMLNHIELEVTPYVQNGELWVSNLTAYAATM